ncbi:MAG: YceI family protein, partial [Myxococcota bacterium]|nr:YceI family protein [Myxococcota bacterium]
ASVVVDYKNPRPWSKKLESHLKSHDFFHSQAVPKAEFVSSSVTKGGMNGTGTHVITGKMSIRGTIREISFPATMSLDGGTFKAKAEFSIRRKRFNIIYPGKPDDLIRDRVVLKLDFTG